MGRSTILAVALALVFAPAAAAKQRVVTRSHTAVVSTNGKTWRGCLVSPHRCWRLATATDDAYDRFFPSRFRLAGRYVAFVATDVDHYNAKSIAIVLVDLRSGRQEGSQVGNTSGDLGQDKLDLKSFVVSPRGWVAWRSRYETGVPGTPPSTERVELNDARGQRLLESGPLGSLGGPAIAGPRKVTWTRDGATKSARAYPR